MEDEAGAEILVDNACAVENITRFAKSAGYAVKAERLAEDVKLTLTKQ